MTPKRLNTRTEILDFLQRNKDWKLLYRDGVVLSDPGSWRVQKISKKELSVIPCNTNAASAAYRKLHPRPIQAFLQ